jgi:hypothetical protein
MSEPVPYEKFKTGLTYQTVYEMLYTGSDDPADWRYKGKSGVLGYWKELKTDMYKDYRRTFDPSAPDPEQQSGDWFW